MSLQALIQFALNAGLMKPRKGFTLVAGKEKLGGVEVANHFFAQAAF
jgi:hypothetical protein